VSMIHSKTDFLPVAQASRLHSRSAGRTPALRWALVAMLGLIVTVHAQTYEQLAPKTLPSASTPALPEPTAVDGPAKPAADQVLAPALRGLVFVPGASALKSDGATAEGRQRSTRQSFAPWQRLISANRSRCARSIGLRATPCFIFGVTAARWSMCSCRSRTFRRARCRS
jgi:hypothetical protein